MNSYYELLINTNNNNNHNNDNDNNDNHNNDNRNQNNDNYNFDKCIKFTLYFILILIIISEFLFGIAYAIIVNKIFIISYECDVQVQMQIWLIISSIINILVSVLTICAIFYIFFINFNKQTKAKIKIYIHIGQICISALAITNNCIILNSCYYYIIIEYNMSKFIIFNLIMASYGSTVLIVEIIIIIIKFCPKMFTLSKKMITFCCKLCTNKKTNFELQMSQIKQIKQNFSINN
jgi:hypothetical protein